MGRFVDSAANLSKKKRERNRWSVAFRRGGKWKRRYLTSAEEVLLAVRKPPMQQVERVVMRVVGVELKGLDLLVHGCRGRCVLHIVVEVLVGYVVQIHCCFLFLFCAE